MSLYRRDDFVTTTQGQAVAGAEVWYCSQPATVNPLPPSPLANIYSDSSGTPATNPQITDGNGHVAVYLESGLYTVVIFGELIGTLVYEDQAVGSSVGAPTPFSGKLSGTQDGVNKAFYFTNNGAALPSNPVDWIVWNNFPLIEGSPSGYTTNGTQVIFENAPAPSDQLYGQGHY